MADRKIRNLASDYLTCTVCWNIFENPKILQCGHSYCAQCLVDYVKTVQKKQDYFDCPVCRHPYDFDPEADPSDLIQALTTDSVSVSILQAIGLKSSKSSTSELQSLPDNVTSLKPETSSFKQEPFCACARHQAKPLDIYCSKHDIVVCSICAFENHSDQECETSPAQKVIKKRLNALQCLVAQQSYDASHLFNSEKEDVKTVRSIHDDIQKCITDVEESFGEIYRFFQSRIETIRKKAKDTVERDMSSTEVRRLQNHLVSKVKSFENGAADCNPNEILKTISDLCLSSSDLQQHIHTLSQKVKTGSLMKYVESDLNILDAFVSGARNTLPSSFLTFEEEAKEMPGCNDFVLVTNSGAFADYEEEGKGQSEISQQVTFNAKLPDEEVCMLSGVALTGTTAVVVVDQANKKLKKFKIPEGKFLNTIAVAYDPHQVVTIRNTSDVAVSCWEVPKIMIVSTDPALNVLRVVDTNTEYIGITSHLPDCLAASSLVSRSVDVLGVRLTDQNVLLKRDTIYQSSRRRSFPDRLGSTQDGKVIVRNRRRNEVCCFDRNRMLLWSRRLKYSVADITCFRGRVYASFRDKNVIVSFREDGQGPLEHLETRSLVKHPWAVDGFKDCLVVTEDAPSAHVHVLLFE